MIFVFGVDFFFFFVGVLTLREKLFDIIVNRNLIVKFTVFFREPYTL